MRGYIVFTESTTDHSKVHIISEFSDYFAANRCARTHAAILMYADQFLARFTPTTPDRLNWIRGDKYPMS